MRVLVAEKLSPHKYKTPEGYLICQDAILARTGKQTYLNREIYGDSIDDPNKEIEIDRPEAEVFSDKTLASFENKPITIEHPDEDVNVDNHNFYSVGFARDIKRGLDNGKPVMIGTLVVTNPDAVADIENGKLLELSCGYDCDIVDNAQTNIRGNHIALCEHGRAGNARIVDSATSFRKNMIKGENVMRMNDDDIRAHFRKIEEDANVLYREYQKGDKSPNEILSARGYRDISGDRLAKYDGEYTYMFDFDDDVYVKYYVLKNGKIPEGYTLTKMRFWDEQTIQKIENGERSNLSCGRAGVIDSKCKDFDDIGKNIRVVKEFIEQNGNKFNKRKDADAILEYIKKRTGIANADYGDVLYIIKEYTRAEITDSIKDGFNNGDIVMYGNLKSKIIRKLTEAEKHSGRYAISPSAGDYYEIEIQPTKHLPASRLIALEMRLKKIADSVKDERKFISDARVGFAGEHKIVGKDFYGYMHVEHPRLGSFYVSFKIKRNGQDVQVDGTPWNFIKAEGYTPEQKRWIIQHKNELDQLEVDTITTIADRQSHNNVEKNSLNDEERYVVYADGTWNNYRALFAKSNMAPRYSSEADAEKFTKADAEKLASMKGKYTWIMKKISDSTYSEVTNELKSELKDQKAFNEKALRAIKIIKAIK